MSDTKYTPGPWKLSGDAPTGFAAYTLAENGQSPMWHVASITPHCGFGSDSTGSQSEANAHLIAAAPELYEACRGMIDVLEYAGTGLIGREADAKEALLTALAKAEGREQETAG